MNYFKLLFFFVLVSGHLSAQAPTDEWRRPGMDPMVAEPGQAASILSNPAGIKSQEERHGLLQNKEKPGKKHEWIIDLPSMDLSITEPTFELLKDPASILKIVTDQISFLERIQDVIDGGNFGDETGLRLMKNISPNLYAQLTAGVKLKNGDPFPGQNDLVAKDIKDLPDADRGRLGTNLNKPGAANAILGEFATIFEDFVYDLGDIGLESYARNFSLAHVNDKKPLAWGFYLGFEQKFLYRRSSTISMPIDFTIKGLNFKSELPVSFQAYFTVPIRVALAHEFNLPGFTFGLGLKAVPYVGLNQNDVGRSISEFLEKEQALELSSVFLAADNLVGMNIGLDLGMQYHFGAITPKLSFLHTGLKVSDVVGFNLAFSGKTPARYAVDFDWGVYAEQRVAKVLQVFGGAEMIQIRGMFEPSPYSALIDPIDHLRLLAGLGLFNNILRISLQYYNNTLSPTIMLNAGAFQMNVGMNIGLSEAQSVGFTLGFRLRSPHNGFNKKAPYKTYSERKAELAVKRQAKEQQGSLENGVEQPSEEDLENLLPDVEPSTTN